MTQSTSSEWFHALFTWHTIDDGVGRLGRHPSAPATLPDPVTGRALRIARVEVGGRAICPACESHGEGGFVSFVADLRLVYACLQCRQLVWLVGA